MFLKKMLITLVYCFCAVSQARYLSLDKKVVENKLPVLDTISNLEQKSKASEIHSCKGCTNALPVRDIFYLSRKKRDFPNIQTRNEQYSQRSYSHHGDQSSNYAYHGQESHITGTLDEYGQLRQQPIPHQEVREHSGHFGAAPGSAIQSHFPQLPSSDISSLPHRRFSSASQNANENIFPRNAFRSRPEGTLPIVNTQNSDYELKVPLGLEVGNNYPNSFRTPRQLTNEFQHRNSADFAQNSDVPHRLPFHISANITRTIPDQNTMDGSSIMRPSYRIPGEQSVAPSQHLVSTQRQLYPISMNQLNNVQAQSSSNYGRAQSNTYQAPSSIYRSSQTINGQAPFSIHRSSQTINRQAPSSFYRSSQAINGPAHSSIYGSSQTINRHPSSSIYGSSQTINGQAPFSIHRSSQTIHGPSPSFHNYQSFQSRHDQFINHPQSPENLQKQIPYTHPTDTHRPNDSNTLAKDFPSTDQTKSVVPNGGTQIPLQNSGSISSFPIGFSTTNYSSLRSISSDDHAMTRQNGLTGAMSVDTALFEHRTENHTASRISHLNLSNSGQRFPSSVSRESYPSDLKESMLTPRLIRQENNHSDSDSASSKTQLQNRFENTTAKASSIGRYNNAGSQTQVQGGVSGNRPFSARAQSGIFQSQDHSGNHGGHSSSNAAVEVGLAQSQIQLNQSIGAASSSAQGRFSGGTTEVRVQMGNSDAISVKSQSRGLSSSQVNLNVAGQEESPHDGFQGTVSASIQRGAFHGQSPTQHQGSHGSGRTYMANAQNGYDTVLESSNPYQNAGFSLNSNISTGYVPMTKTDTAIPATTNMSEIVQREQFHVPRLPIGSGDIPRGFGGSPQTSMFGFHTEANNGANFHEQTLGNRGFSAPFNQKERTELEQYPGTLQTSDGSRALISSRVVYPQGLLDDAYPLGSSGDTYPLDSFGVAYPHTHSSALHPLSSIGNAQSRNFFGTVYPPNLQNTEHSLGSSGSLPPFLPFNPVYNNAPSSPLSPFLPPNPVRTYALPNPASPLTPASSVHSFGSSSAVHKSDSSNAVHAAGSFSATHPLDSFSDIYPPLDQSTDVRNKLNDREHPGITNVLQETIQSGQQSSFVPSFMTDNTQFQHREHQRDSSLSFPHLTSESIQPDRRNHASSAVLQENFRYPQEIRLPYEQMGHQPQSSHFSGTYPSNLQSHTIPQDIKQIHSRISQEMLPQNVVSSGNDNLQLVHPTDGTGHVEDRPTDIDLRLPGRRAEISPNTRLLPSEAPVKTNTDQIQNLEDSTQFPGVEEPEGYCCGLLRNLKGRCCSRSSTQTGDNSKSQCCFGSGVGQDIATNIQNGGREPCKVVRAMCYIVYKSSGKARICRRTQTKSC